MPPSAAGTPPCAFAAITGAMNAKLEPVYDGTRFFVIRLNRIVPMPEKKIVVVTGNPVRTGTSAVAPNMARMCWPPSPSMFGMCSRSSGLTTAPGSTVLPSPCSFHTLSTPVAISLPPRGRVEIVPRLPAGGPAPDRDADQREQEPGEPAGDDHARISAALRGNDLGAGRGGLRL